MSAEYTLLIKNDGTKSEGFCILQESEEQSDRYVILDQKDILPNSEEKCSWKVSDLDKSNSQSNVKYTRIPHPEYWVAFGEFETGKVIDKSLLSQKYKIKFDDNNKCAIVLTSDNTFKQTK